MPNCELGGKGLLILLSKQHTVDLHFTSGNWGFKLGSRDTKDVFCGSSLALTAKPLCNLGQLNVSGSPCSQVGQAWNSQGAKGVEQPSSGARRTPPLPDSTGFAICLSPLTPGGAGVGRVVLTVFNILLR